MIPSDETLIEHGYKLGSSPIGYRAEGTEYRYLTFLGQIEWGLNSIETPFIKIRFNLKGNITQQYPRDEDATPKQTLRLLEIMKEAEKLGAKLK